MKQGRTLAELAAELQRQANARKDFIAAQGRITAIVAPETKALTLTGLNGPLTLTDYAHGQLGDLLEIPRKYYDRMLVHEPQLLADNLNTWLTRDGNTQRMVRTLDGEVRAVLSPKYRPLDNFELAEQVLPVLIKHEAQVMSCELTATRMYIKAILPALSDALPEGMTWGQGHQMVGRDGRLVAAIVISNSDVGAGTLRVEPSVFTTWCTNLAVMQQAAMKKYHIGRANSADDSLEVFRDETRQQDDLAFWMKVQDVTMAAFSEDKFKAAIAQIKAAAKDPITSLEQSSDNLPAVVEATVRELNLPVRATTGILGALAAGGDISRWGLSSAVTMVANTFPDYEGATDLERAGGAILTLPPRQWDAIAMAVAKQ